MTPSFGSHRMVCVLHFSHERNGVELRRDAECDDANEGKESGRGIDAFVLARAWINREIPVAVRRCRASRNGRGLTVAPVLKYPLGSDDGRDPPA
jgi:hypothetical protein